MNLRQLIRFSRARITVLIVLTTLVLGAPPAAHAATINVGCSVTELINAINTANGNGTADTLELSAGCTYTLTTVHNEDDFGPSDDSAA